MSGEDDPSDEDEAEHGDEPAGEDGLDEGNGVEGQELSEMNESCNNPNLRI